MPEKRLNISNLKTSCFTNCHFLFYKLPLWSRNTTYITFFGWISKIWLLSFLFRSFLWAIEEFHPVKSGVCGYYVKNILEPSYILNISNLKTSCFTNCHFLFYKLPLWSRNTTYITFFGWISKIWLLSFLFRSFLWAIEEFHPVKSGVCGYYVKNILEPKFILFD